MLNENVLSFWGCIEQEAQLSFQNSLKQQKSNQTETCYFKSENIHGRISLIYHNKDV